MIQPDIERPSIEHLIEGVDLGIETLHPGGLALTSDLAHLCGIRRGLRVLDVACGTGESAYLLSEKFGASVTCVDASPRMVLRARSKAERRGLHLECIRADAHALPFREASFEVALCECALCHLEKQTALREMLRVIRPGGIVGIHDLCWREGTSTALKLRLKELEQEEPENSAGWRRQFEEAGLTRVVLRDHSDLIRTWTRETRSQLGVLGYVRATWKALSKWGFVGLSAILASERLFASPHLGYVVVTGYKAVGDGRPAPQ